jgi:hypothetical protein
MNPETTTMTNATRSLNLWPWVPVLLLGSMLVGLGGMAYLAINDPGFALEPNYYDKAVHWDQSQAEAAASRALGLQVTFSKPLELSKSGALELELSIRDRDGASFSGARVELEAFANAHASRIESVLLRETAPGVYSAEIARGSRGLWELRIAVRRGDVRYRDVVRAEVGKGDSA